VTRQTTVHTALQSRSPTGIILLKMLHQNNVVTESVVNTRRWTVGDVFWRFALICCRERCVSVSTCRCWRRRWRPLTAAGGTSSSDNPLYTV